MAAKPVVRSFDGRDVKLTNLDKLLFPDDGIRKGEVIDYVVAAAEPLLAAPSRSGSGRTRGRGSRKAGWMRRR